MRHNQTTNKLKRMIRKSTMLKFLTSFAFMLFVLISQAQITSSFTVNQSQQCFNVNSFVFTNTSSSGAGITYAWDFGDGTTSTQVSPTKNYSTSGYYSVQLITDSGGIQHYANQTVIVSPLPTAAFYTIASTTSGNTYTFISTSTIANGVMNYAWDFGDGTTSTLVNPIKGYSATGTYNVKLVVTSDAGCKDSVTQAIVITTTGSTTSLTSGFAISSNITQCLSGNNFTFTNSSTTGIGVTYLWNFGDGNTSPLATPSHSYLANGNYTVTLTVSAAGSADAVSSQNVSVSNPSASFSVNNSGNSYNFSASSVSGATYAWDLGDASTASTATVSNKVYAAGNYDVKLVVTGTGGCKDSTTQSINVLPAPTAAFTVTSASTQCTQGSLFTFNNTSTSGAGVTYLWDFGDNSTHNIHNPTKIYSNPGTYTITLTVTTSGGTSTATQTVIVNPSPSVSFSSSVAGSVATFTNNTTISSGTVTYSWDFADGFTSVVPNPIKSFADGSYAVKLIATSNLGCVDSATNTVSVGSLPMSAFTVSSATTQCSNSDNFTFLNTSTTGVGVTYLWDFGDGTTSILPNPTKSYTGAGTFTVSLTVTNAVGSVTSTQSVVVLAGPTVTFATYSNTNSGGSYTFVSNSSVPAGTMTYYWDLGDGTLEDSTVNVTHTYAAPGTYTVKLIVIGSGGCSDSSSTTVTFCPKVTAGFNVTSLTSQCVSGNSFTFANTSTNNAGIPASSMVYTWSFGDSTFSSLQTPPAHTYAAWGDYDVKLLATLTSGSCVIKDSITKLKAVSAEPMPVASYLLILDNFYVPTALLSDTTKRCWHPGYDFSYQSSSTLGRGVMDYFWHFGTSALFFRDGDSSHYINPRIVFDTASTYPVQLMVVSDKGCKDSVTRIVELSDPRSRFNFTIDSTTDVYASPVVSVTNYSYDYGGYLVAWNWNLGSNATPASSNSQNPSSFTYTCGGAKNVVLTVTSDVGCTADTTRNFVIRIKPKAAFTISAPNYTPTIYARPTYTYNNGTTVNDACPSMSYAWNFGDGYTGTGTTPTHIYKGSGTYTTTMVATNGNGGKKDTTTQTVTVAIKPRANFNFSLALSPDVYANSTVTFTNASTVTDTATSVAALGYAWDFGDGVGTSNVANPPNYQYPNGGGTYNVTLIVTNPVSGLMDTITKVVVVSIKPHALFTTGAAVYSPDVYAQPNYTFTNGTTVNDASAIMSYAWDFGDLGTSTGTSPNHTYTSGGTYTVTLIATNGNGGLTDTAISTITVKIKPQAAFSSNVDYGGDIYSNPTVTFTDATTSNDGAPVYTYSWNFGDPASGASNISTLQNPTHIYTSGGTFSATLTVTNTNGGLTDVVSNNVVIVITPKAVLSVHIDTVSVPVPMSIGNADYKHYTLTALSNLANPSTVVTGSIAHTEIKIDTVYIPSSATNQYADVLDADAEFAIQLDTVPNYLFNITLTVTSDLGVTDVTTATLGASESGFTPYRGLNPNATLPTVALPSIGSTRKPVAPTAPIAAAKKGLVVYPNPASEMITVGVDVTTKTSNVNVLLYNSNGKLVQSQKNGVDNLNATRVNVPMNITSLSSGIYNIIVLDNKGVILGIGKCVKSRN